MNALSICAGVGAMDIGVRLAVGDSYRCVGYVEREAYAAAVLVARMEDEALDRAPIFDDLASFDGRPYRGCVDLISAGLPCQPYSVAGAMRGHADERALWPEFVRIVAEVEPAVVFLENVPAFRRHFEPVWRELRELGFEWAPPLLQTASESGAPHIRERFFALAAHPERVALWDEQGRIDGAHWPGQAGPRDARGDDPDSRESGLEGRRLSGCGRADKRAPRPVGYETPDDDGERCEGDWCGWLFDPERQTLRHDADRCGSRCRIAGTPWSVESPAVTVDAADPDWVEQLRAIGNVGAPPVAYARAFLTLLAEVV